MYDNNLNQEKRNVDITQQQKESSILLKQLVIEYEEQLFSVKMQLKTQNYLLQEKEQALAEKERTKIYNKNLFSPIYSKDSDTSELEASLEQIRNTIQTLNMEMERLNQVISGLNTASSCMEQVISHSEDKEPVKEVISKPSLNDKGLSILEAQEIERQRIARDLHDTTVQNLTSLVHKCELCVKLIDIDTIRAKLELNSMANTLKTVINDMRGIIYNLKPMTLDDLGLTITIQRFASRLMDSNNIDVKVKANEECKNIHPIVKLSLFRVVQESCNNVIKHANASLININICYEIQNITITIQDDGSGFDTLKSMVPHTCAANSFGLSIMRERITLLSGTLDISSEEGNGTIVTVTIPNANTEGGEG